MAGAHTRAARRAFKGALALAFAPWLSGCILTTDTLPTGAVVDVPPKYREASGTPHAALPAPDWWRGFRSRELTTLVERARERRRQAGERRSGWLSRGARR